MRIFRRPGAPPMNTNAQKFLDEWVRERVVGVPYSEQKRQASDTYAPACLGAAARAGITRREIVEAAGGNLVDYLEVAIEDKWDVIVRKNLPVQPG
jgi:hypothetical protein